jgi:hypothetical protein
MSWLNKLERIKAVDAERDADPLREKVELLVGGMESISTAALLDLLGLRATTANARQLAKTMRALNFIPLKSRRLLPGGWEGTVVRGWSRPVRQSPTNPKQGEKAERCRLYDPMKTEGGEVSC